MCVTFFSGCCPLAMPSIGYSPFFALCCLMLSSRFHPLWRVFFFQEQPVTYKNVIVSWWFSNRGNLEFLRSERVHVGVALPLQLPGLEVPYSSLHVRVSISCIFQEGLVNCKLKGFNLWLRHVTLSVQCTTWLAPECVWFLVSLGSTLLMAHVLRK